MNYHLTQKRGKELQAATQLSDVSSAPPGEHVEFLGHPFVPTMWGGWTAQQGVPGKLTIVPLLLAAWSLRQYWTGSMKWSRYHFGKDENNASNGKEIPEKEKGHWEWLRLLVTKIHRSVIIWGLQCSIYAFFHPPFTSRPRYCLVHLCREIWKNLHILKNKQLNT